jgi:hypothetical protein
MDGAAFDRGLWLGAAAKYLIRNRNSIYGKIFK